jgi:hypothetical protein
MPMCVASIHALERERRMSFRNASPLFGLLLSLKLQQTQQRPMLIVRWGLDQAEMLLSAT